MERQEVCRTTVPDVPSGLNSKDIDRRENLSYKDFFHEYVRPLRPVIITDAIKDWKALSKWTPEFFKNRYASKVVAPFDDTKEYRMDEYIDLVMGSSDQRPAPYLRNIGISEYFPDLFEDLQPSPSYFYPNWLTDHFMVNKLNEILNRAAAHELYIGGTGTHFPMIHYDGLHTHAFICHIYGRKEFIAFSPDQTPFMHPKRKLRNRSNVNDVEHPDLTKYPNFAHAKPIRFYLEPGETFFIPSGWWHTARLLTPAISVSVNVANSSNWSNLTKDLCFLMKNRFMVLPLAAYLTFYKLYKSAFHSLSEWGG